MDFSYPRETVEFVYFRELKINGAPPPAELDIEYSLTRGLARPTVWKPMLINAGKFAFLLDGTLPAGEYQVFVRVALDPERTVIEAGRIQLT